MTGSDDAELDEDELAHHRRVIARQEIVVWFWVGVAITVVAGIGTWFAKWDAVRFTDVEVWGPRTLALRIECTAPSRATVWESDDRIEIALDQRPPDDNHDCVDYHCVVLDADLGVRSVVEHRTGRDAIVTVRQVPARCDDGEVAGPSRSQRLPTMSTNTANLP